ncbi:MAG: Arp2/3 complex subunit, actin nucleation center [Marteilia pararefringens]
MLTQASESPLKHTQYLLEVFLEKYGFAKAYVATQGYLALVGSGFTTGIVLDSGAGVSHIIPFYENTVLKSARLDIAGHHVTNHLLSLFQRRGYSMNHSADYILCDKIKRSYCFVAQNSTLEQKLCDETTYNDHRIKTEIGEINASDELFMAPEILFTPSHVENESSGIGEMLFDTIQKQAPDLRMNFYKAIVLSGGTTMTPGIRTRLHNDLRQLSTASFGKVTAQKQMPKILDNPNRTTSVFRGAGMLANFAKDSSNDFWVTADMLRKDGPQRCIAKFL